MLSLKERADWAVVVGRVAASVTEPRFWGMTGSQARVIRTSKAAVFLALPAADRRNALDTWSLRVGSGPDEGTVCFVEGEFFADPVGCEGKVGDAGRGLADAVVEAWKARRLPGLLRTLNGPWSGFILDGAGGRLLLFHDRWMFHEVYFTQRPGCTAATTNSGFLRLDEVLPEKRLRRAGVLEFLMEEYVSAPDTMLEGVQTLQRGAVATLTARSWSQEYYVEVPEHREHVKGGWRLIREGADVYRAALGRIHRRAGEGKALVGLTGGKDSRIPLGMARSLGIPVEAFNLVRHADKRRDINHQLARVIAAAAGVKLHSAQYAEHPLYWSGELIAHLVRSTFPFPAANRVWSILAHEAADRGAGLCLIGYDTFMGGFSRVIPASTPSVEKLARLRYELNVEGLPAAAAVARVFRGGRPAELGEQVQETLVSSLARQPGTSPVQKLISYQGESGAGLRDKMSNRSGRVFVQSVAPLIDNEISDFFLSLPQRELHHARLYHRLLAPVNPVLAAIPTNVGKVVPLALMGDFYPVVRAARVAEVRVKTRLGRPLEGVVCEEERRVVTRLVEESEEFDPDGLDAVFASPYVTGHLKLLLCALKEFRGEEVKWA